MTKNTNLTPTWFTELESIRSLIPTWLVENLTRGLKYDRETAEALISAFAAMQYHFVTNGIEMVENSEHLIETEILKLDFDSTKNTFNLQGWLPEFGGHWETLTDQSAAATVSYVTSQDSYPG